MPLLRFFVTLLVSSIVVAEGELKPKNIDVSLAARWPQTPIAVEAAEYLAAERPALFWSFVEAWKEPESVSDAAQLAAVEASASTLLSPLGVKVLKVFLAAHVLSPKVEAWRQLALEAQKKHTLPADAPAWVLMCGRAMVLDDASKSAATIQSFLSSADAASCKNEEALPQDHVLGQPGSAKAFKPTVVLQAPVGSAVLADAHASLKERAHGGGILYIFRPLVRPAAGAGAQTLQGYGVQLAIKNMEYKAMDDAKADDLGGIEEADDVAAETEGEETEEQGFLFKTIASRRPELKEQLSSFREVLASSEGDASQLKVWALQDLGVQAASRVLSAKNPLQTLRDICQNFPFMARSLSKTKASPQLEDEIANLQSSSWGPGYSGAFLNGRPLPVQQNDLFSLLQTMQRELQTVDALSSLGLPSATIRSLVSLPAPTAALRINASHPSVVMLNDVGKDRKYAQWPASVKELLRPSMFGQIPFCRKNVYTLIFVVDPGTELGQLVLAYMIGILQNGAPVRFGIVLTPGAARKSVSAKARTAVVPGSNGARLLPLASVYENPTWEGDADVKAMEAKAQSPGGDALPVSSVASDDDASDDGDAESERLGLLMSKLFMFCKRKLGSSTAVNFLAQSQEVREVGGFFGSSFEPLEERHLSQAFEQAVRMSRKQILPEPIFEGLRSGELTDFDEELNRGLEFLAEKGLSAPPLLLTNGMLTPITANYESEIMSALGSESQNIAGLVRRGKLTDQDADVSQTIAAASATFPRYNKDLLVTADKIKLADLRMSEAIKTSMHWIHKEADAAVGEDDEKDSDHAKDVKPVSHLLAVDLCERAHIELVAHALQALDQSPGGRSRLAILHNPSAAHVATCVSPIASWTDLASSATTLEPLRTLLALLLLSTAAGVSAPLSSSLLPAGLAGRAGASVTSGATATLIAAHRATCAQIELQPGVAAVITNGRLVEVQPGTMLDAVDLGLLEEFEHKQRSQGAAGLVGKLAPPAGSDTSDQASVAWRSDVLMLTVAHLTKMAQASQEASSGRQVQLQSGDIPCGAACIQLPGSGVGAAMELVAILNPLSKEAQRFTPIMLALQEALGLTITLHLNPDLKMSEFPLENFYRYVVDLVPAFDEKGASIAHQTDHAIFSSLRTPQVLTLHIDAPEPWLVEVTEALYDMDNIKLIELGEKRTLTARYELASLLITGACEDVEARDPPNGLQLLLGTETAPHVTDTLVMSNLGYFQLKAAPGSWQLQLAPGPSSDVYEIRADPSLLSTGHSMRASERRAIDVDRLVVVPQLRIVVTSFSGEHTLLFVKKQPGMQGVSILDDDKQQGSSPPKGAASSEDGGMLSSLSKWMSGNSVAQSGADETVHIFSLASGHLYERFLKIMMMSVVERTSRPVKFWLLKNFLSPGFMGFLPVMAAEVGFEYELVQYQWPTWLHKQTNKQRIIWGYKILFLDVMFPLHLRKIIYIDADQVVNADVAELWDMKMSRHAAIAMTPFCNKDANQHTTGFRFFAQGYWRDHLRGRPYHISALFVVDLFKLRRRAYGDQYRILYDNLSKDPNSLSNLDQDLPNYAQHQVPIHSLPEEWLWCETWCGNSSKPTAKTIDLCNNPLTKEPKLSQATRVIGDRWSALDDRAKAIGMGEQSGGAASASPGAAQKRDEL